MGTGYPEGVAPHVRVMGFPSTATGCSGKIYVFPGACLILMSMVAFPVRVTFPLPIIKKGKKNKNIIEVIFDPLLAGFVV